MDWPSARSNAIARIRANSAEFTNSCQVSFIARPLSHLDDVVQKWIGYFQELMRHAVGHHDDVAFCDLTGFAITNAAAAQLVCGSFFCVHGFATGHKCCASIEDIDHVCVLGMDLRLAGLFPPA